MRVRNRAVSGATASSLLTTPSPAYAVKPRQMGTGAAPSTLPPLRALCSFASRLARMTQWAQALPVAVDVLATNPQRDGVIQLEGPRSAGCDVNQLAAVSAVGAIPEPDAQTCSLSTTTTIPRGCPDPRSLLHRVGLQHLNPNGCSSDARSFTHITKPPEGSSNMRQLPACIVGTRLVSSTGSDDFRVWSLLIKPTCTPPLRKRKLLSTYKG